MVCYTLDEQNEIINEFLDVIDANDMIREFKDIFYHSSSKYDNIKIALKQSILPDTAIELIRHLMMILLVLFMKALIMKD